MKPNVLVIFLALTALAVVGPVRAAESEAPSISIQVPGGDKLSASVPAGWKSSLDRPPAGIPPTLDLTGPGGTLLKITFLANPQARAIKSEDLDALLTQGSEQYIANSVEKRVTLTRINSKSGPGVYSVFTDSRLAGVTAPAPGEFRNVTSGVLAVGRQIVIFALLSNGTDSDEYRRAMEVVTNGLAIAVGGA